MKERRLGLDERSSAHPSPEHLVGSPRAGRGPAQSPLTSGRNVALGTGVWTFCSALPGS